MTNVLCQRRRYQAGKQSLTPSVSLLKTGKESESILFNMSSKIVVIKSELRRCRLYLEKNRSVKILISKKCKKQ